MVKPDTLWAFLKTAKDDVVVGRICRSLGGQMVSPPLNQLEEALLKVIAQGNEWHTEAIDKDLARRRARYAAQKAEREAARAEGISEISVEKTEKEDSPQSPPIHPSVHPSIHPSSSKENVIKESAENPARRTAFKPPTLDEVRAYVLERKSKVDAEKWFDFYSSKGWMIGKNKMVDWKAAVRTWEKEQLTQAQSRAARPSSGQRRPDQSQFDGLEGV